MNFLSLALILLITTQLPVFAGERSGNGQNKCNELAKIIELKSDVNLPSKFEESKDHARLVCELATLRYSLENLYYIENCCEEKEMK